MYADKTITKLSLLIPVKNIEGIQPGDWLANTNNDKERVVIFDGGVDMRSFSIHRTQTEIRRLQSSGKGIVLSKNGGLFQYVVRKN